MSFPSDGSRAVRPPESRYLMNLSPILLAHHKAWILLAATITVVVIALLDFATGWGYSFFVFYAVPILIVVWFANQTSAILIALFCGIAWFMANLTDQPYPSRGTYVWASMNRGAYFVFVAVGATAMRHYRDESRARVEAMSRARELEQEILRTSERERMRIGQDLHDGLCQNLAAIDCAAECLRANLEAQSLPDAAAAGVIQKLLKNALIEARNLARGIYPPQLAGDGLPTALEDLANSTCIAGRITVTAEIDPSLPEIPDEAALHLYRITQEAVSNALKHGRASQVTINLKTTGPALLLTITDDGKGFAPDAARSRGLGLNTMRYRTEAISGEFTIESQPAGGTVIRCIIPLSYEATD